MSRTHEFFEPEIQASTLTRRRGKVVTSTVQSTSRLQSFNQRVHILLMHPVIFIGACVGVGTLFALQNLWNLHRWGYRIQASIEFESWGVEFFLWGVICWLIWRFLGSFIQNGKLGIVFICLLPLSLAASFIRETTWVLIFPNLPLGQPHMPFWPRLQFHFSADLIENLVVFWSAILLIRGVGYYQRSQESERNAAQLEAQLANAKLSALRMQLNPHFLFNALNCVSSLMRSDVDAADKMLEQLSDLLRITLQRGSLQLISLKDEVDFIEVYISLQDWRYGDRVRREIVVEPELYDALIPAMLLQPIVENAYVHGISKIERAGELTVNIRRSDSTIVVTVTNSGVGLQSPHASTIGHGVGLSTAHDRLQLLYGDAFSLDIYELPKDRVQVKIIFPVQYAVAG